MQSILLILLYLSDCACYWQFLGRRVAFKEKNKFTGVDCPLTQATYNTMVSFVIHTQTHAHTLINTHT